LSGGYGATSRSRAPRQACSGCSRIFRSGGYDGDVLASERVQAAVVLAASGNLARLRQMLDLATADWRDALVAAELADEGWQQRLDIELGPQG
jgi:hypothetical protein